MNNEPLAGYTHEGLPVPKSEMNDELTLVLFSLGKCDPGGISIAIEFNKTPSGKRRPYLAIHLFSILIQSGWLF